jgi:peptide/nickel transport system substrate-binding protein
LISASGSIPDSRRHTRPALSRRFGAEHVIHTLRRIADPADPKNGAVRLTSLDLNAMQALDARTVRLPLTRPDVTVPDQFAECATGIVPVGYDPNRPVGTCPFAFDSFEPDQQSLFTKSRNYGRSGEPYVDEVLIIDFPDDMARINALLGGQVDAIDQVPLGLRRVLNADPNLRVPDGSWVPFTMRVDRPPFDDVRERQAFRLVVDREQMIKQVLGGHGTIGNDLYSPTDPLFNSTLPQRKRDVATAAGGGQGEPDRGAGDLAGGVRRGGGHADVRPAGRRRRNHRERPPGDSGDMYLSWDFAQDYWFTRGFLA